MSGDYSTYYKSCLCNEQGICIVNGDNDGGQTWETVSLECEKCKTNYDLRSKQGIRSGQSGSNYYLFPKNVILPKLSEEYIVKNSSYRDKVNKIELLCNKFSLKTLEDCYNELQEVTNFSKYYKDGKFSNVLKGYNDYYKNNRIKTLKDVIDSAIAQYKNFLTNYDIVEPIREKLEAEYDILGEKHAKYVH